MERKKEYQSLVSPIVRKGGRSKLIHRPIIKRKNTKANTSEMETSYGIQNRFEHRKERNSL